MKKLFVLLSLIYCVQCLATVHAQSEVRWLYQKAATEEASCKKLLTLLKPFNESNNTLLAGYKACATMIMANYIFNPFSKLSFFLKGKKLLEKVILKDKENVELRFLRFTVQTNAPPFLSYHHATKDDKLFLIKSVASITDIHLKQIIISFLTNSDQLTVGEKQRLNS